MGILTKLELDYEIDDIEKFLQFFRTMCDRFEPLIIKLGSDSMRYKEAIKELETLAHNTACAIISSQNTQKSVTSSRFKRLAAQAVLCAKVSSSFMASL